MEDDRIPLGHLVQDPQGAAPRVQKVFGNDLEPIDLRSVPENVAEMCGPEAHSQAQIRTVQSNHWSIPLRIRGITIKLSAEHAIPQKHSLRERDDSIGGRGIKPEVPVFSFPTH